MSRPEKCPAGCEGAGVWGATGVLPAGHHIHWTAGGGFYLAHGMPGADDLGRYVAMVLNEYESEVHRARMKRNTRLIAAGVRVFPA